MTTMKGGRGSSECRRPLPSSRAPFRRSPPRHRSKERCSNDSHVGLSLDQSMGCRKGREENPCSQQQRLTSDNCLVFHWIRTRAI